MLKKIKKSKLLIKDIELMRVFMSFFSTIIKLIKYVLRTNNARYVFFTPSVMQRQIFYDKQEKKYISIFIRNKIDYITFTQIYINEDYGMTKLKRYADIFSFYKNNINIAKQLLIIDCGGNIGLATRYFAEQYKMTKVVCIEPDVENINQAQINNFDKNVDFINAAVGSEEGFGTILDSGLGNNAYQIMVSKKGKIDIVSINKLLSEYVLKGYIPFIIKIDIEGFESDLFSKNIEWIELFPVLIIELHDWMFPRSNKSRNFLKSVAQLDRDFVHIGENIFSISNTII
jgi:FkbM family methyltransferase